MLGFQLPLFFLYDFLSTFSLLSLLSFDHFKNMIFRSSFTRHKLHTGKVLSSFCICKRTGDHNLFLVHCHCENLVDENLNARPMQFNYDGLHASIAGDDICSSNIFV